MVVIGSMTTMSGFRQRAQRSSIVISVGAGNRRSICGRYGGPTPKATEQYPKVLGSLQTREGLR
jgi:hypothetical protein